MDRRQAIGRMGATALGALAGACTHIPSFVAPRVAPVRAALTPVRVGWDQVIRTVVGLRPYRAAGFVVRADRYDEKLVIHDYGHGGGGVTLSWGTAALAVEEALRTEDTSIAVIGCGVVGLSTARLLQQRGRSVTLYAAQLPPDTTSNVAGAQWTPFSVFSADAITPGFEAQFQRASRIAYRMYQDYVGARYGVRWIDNWYIGDQPIRPPAFIEALRDLFPDREDVPRAENPFGTPYAQRVSTLFIEPTPYLRALTEDVRLAGGRIVVREFRDLNELLGVPERVIMNCTGLGARELFADEALVPVKGQLIVLRPQHDVDYLLLANRLYMFPRTDGILLGGTFVEGDWSLAPDPEATRRIVEGHMSLFDRA
ncbi:MAG: FAD-binding oxidoreductase [Gemmatimonadetes bacterium]|nr:FAD-binding oxidoreductase [Gemmatimonadota bacterium]